MEIWEYTGEPTQEEILKLEPHYKNNPFAIRHICPNCEGLDTAWLRQEWSMCFHCVIAFNGLARYYDVQAYEQDDRIEREVLEELND